MEIMESILLIDDDQNLGVLLKEYFSKFQFSLVHSTKPSEALNQIKNKKFEAVILDVMLPEMDGFETFKQIRKISEIPVLMLTARGDLTDKVLGLEMGVDDYLPKPFEPRELVARIKALIRRTNKNPGLQSNLKSGDIILNLQAHTVMLKGKDLGLSTHEFAVLKLFMTHPGQVLSRDKILDELRGIDWESYNRSVDVAVSRLRQKLGDSAKAPHYLKTVWGDGYCFIEAVEEIK
jgi:two-component system phosphate regulon response regulator OmpR